MEPARVRMDEDRAGPDRRRPVVMRIWFAALLLALLVPLAVRTGTSPAAAAGDAAEGGTAPAAPAVAPGSEPDTAGHPGADNGPDPEAVAAAAPAFWLTHRRLAPKSSLPGAIRRLRLHFRFRSPRPLPVVIRFMRRENGAVIRRLVLGGKAGIRPGRWHRVAWNGRTRGGRLAPPGYYVALAGPPGGPFRRIGRFRFHGHRHPVAGPHGTRGAVGEFGAGRTGGRIHQGFDVTGRCGTPLVAVRSGRILKVATDPALRGNYVIMKGEGERRTYLYAHMRKPAAVRRGQRVGAGRRLGAIGRTGNAASTPCHLHIEIRSRGRLLDPRPILRSWER